MLIERRLAELGLELPEPMTPPPGAELPFPWVRVWNGRAFVSGHGPLNADGSLAQPLGKVGRDLSVEQGYTALKFDPFGHTSRVVGPDEEALAIDLIEAVRDAIGPRVDLLVEGHCRFNVAQAIRFAQRMAPSNPLWFEEPVPHHDPDSVVEVARTRLVGRHGAALAAP